MTTDSIQDLVKRLRAIDHTSVEDCFLQSPYFHKAADALEAMAGEVQRLKEERDAARDDEELMSKAKQLCEAERDRTRADYEALKAHNKELFGKLSAAELERDRLKAALDIAKDHAKQNQRARDLVSPYPNDHAKRIVWEKALYHEGKGLWAKLRKALGDAS